MQYATDPFFLKEKINSQSKLSIVIYSSIVVRSSHGQPQFSNVQHFFVEAANQGPPTWMRLFLKAHFDLKTMSLRGKIWDFPTLWYTVTPPLTDCSTSTHSHLALFLEILTFQIICVLCFFSLCNTNPSFSLNIKDVLHFKFEIGLCLWF